MHPTESKYLLANQISELERLRLQSQVWEPAGRSLLARLPDGAGKRALDVGCGAMGWLPLLSDWVGVGGEVVGSEVDPGMLVAAKRLRESQDRRNIRLVFDNLFNSSLPRASFDLVHARFQIAPLGQPETQIAAYLDLLKPGGHLVLEDPDISTWRVHPGDAACQELIVLIDAAFRANGGNLNAGRDMPGILQRLGLRCETHAQVLTLDAGHPYLRLPLQFADALRPRLLALIDPVSLARLLQAVEAELARPDCWGTTFMLMQCVVAKSGV